MRFVTGKVIRLLVVFTLLLGAYSSALLPQSKAEAAGTATKVVVSQAGYSSGDYKVAYVLATDTLSDTTYQVYNGSTQIASGTMTYEGVTWGDYVYSVDFSGVTQTGTSFTIRSNGLTSYSFPIQTNMWDSYKDEMTAYYRIQRQATATADVLPTGYTNTPPSAKAYHPAGSLDDVNVGGSFVDLTGSWYDAGDYGKYAGNQWVAGSIAITYLRHASSAAVRFDNDNNGIPDIIDEAKFGSEYLIKCANSLGGAVYNINPVGGWLHPEKTTDNIPGTSDDRVLGRIGIGGSAKGAGSLAATARAINDAIAHGYIAAGKVAELQAFSTSAANAAVTLYNYAVANQSGDEGTYETIGGIANPLLFAEAELYFLTNTASYKTSAQARISTLTFKDVRATNYWDMRPMALADFYPAADASVKTQIQSLLKQRMDYFISSTDDTPYGVLDELGDFGVNEPLMSYAADAIKYYELFGDPAALRAAKKALYWVVGDNPYNVSWVSGIGTNYTKFMHTRLDEEAYDPNDTGIVLTGAMASGVNIKDPNDPKSVSPWYQDRGVFADNMNQWRYNEHSISIQAGLFYTIMALTDLNTNPAVTSAPAKISVLSPKVGDYVTGDVKLFAVPAAAMTSMDYAVGGETSTFNTMGTAVNGVYTSAINVASELPLASKRVTVRGTDASGNKSYSAAHFSVAAPLPSINTPSLYDDFANKGTWGSKNTDWVNWWNQNGGTGTYAKAVIDGRNVGEFSQTPTSVDSWAKFEPWHDTADLRGYRYVQMNMKNLGYPDARVKISVEDGSNNFELSGGFISVPTTWSTYTFDLDQFPTLNKATAHFVVWLNQTSVQTGKIAIDDITALNQSSGSAPTISGTSLSATSGDENTVFTFHATYTDADNQKPFAMQVITDGVIHDMTEDSAGDTTYTDGKAYSFSTKLALGTHSYYFRTTDTTSSIVQTTAQSAPVVSQSSTPPPATTAKYEAETAVTNGTVENNSNASGGYLVGYLDSTGKYVQFNNTIGAATLTMRYATMNSGTFSLYKNGTHYMDISVASTGDWYTFADKTITVSAAAGDSLKLQKDSGDVAINLDYISLGDGSGGGGGTPPAQTKYEAENAIYTGTMENNSNASGGYLVGFLDVTGRYVQFNNVSGGTSLKLRYARESGSGTFSLYKNGVHYMDISITPTGGWYTFADKVVTVSVAAGDTLKLQNDSGDVAINLDYVELAP